jgi:hypothetical protein
VSVTTTIYTTGETPLGHREIDRAAHPHPKKVWPVRIAADAVAPGAPSRDLCVSPVHGLLFDDVLVAARFLLNGSTIAQEPVARVSYGHIEPDSHDMILAEGLAAESYLDCANRHTFANSGAVTSLHPDFGIPDLGAKIWAERPHSRIVRRDRGLRLFARGWPIAPSAWARGRQPIRACNFTPTASVSGPKRSPAPVSGLSFPNQQKPCACKAAPPFSRAFVRAAVENPGPFPGSESRVTLIVRWRPPLI